MIVNKHANRESLTSKVEVVDMSSEEMSTDDIIAKLYNELKI